VTAFLEYFYSVTPDPSVQRLLLSVFAHGSHCWPLFAYTCHLSQPVRTLPDCSGTTNSSSQPSQLSSRSHSRSRIGAEDSRNIISPPQEGRKSTFHRLTARADQALPFSPTVFSLARLLPVGSITGTRAERVQSR